MTHERLDVDQVLQQLTVNDKVLLLSGRDFWNLNDVPRLKVPPVRVSDGPNGVRGSRFFNGAPANCYPSSTGLGASFDVELAERIGQALGNECRAKGAHVLLGPTCNMQRSPLGGRSFESFAEDPTLSGMITAAYCNGVQSKQVAACVKHFVANEQEFERFSNDSIVSQRALRELYLEPFRLAVKHAKPWCFMSSYNKVNGIHASESKQLLTDILRKEWGFDGLVMSDWTGVYSTDTSIKAGLDLEMPGPSTMRGDALQRQIAAGRITISDLDERVRNVLNLVNHAIDSGIPFKAEEKSVDTPESRALLREAATAAIVLLKNEQHTLPLKSPKSIAVIGGNAKVPVPSGGGSAALRSTYTISPLEGIRAAAEEVGATVEFATGVAAFRYVPLIDQYIKDGKVEIWSGDPLQGDWFKGPSHELGEPDWSENCTSSLAFMIDGVPYEKLHDVHARYSGHFTPDLTAEWTFSLNSIGQATLLIDGELVIENVESRQPGELFFGAGSDEKRAKFKVEAGKTYLVEVRHWKDVSDIQPGPFALLAMAVGFRVGAYPLLSPEHAREEAVALAQKSDVAVVIVGTNADWESEGFDRKTIALPGESDELVRAILAVNPKTVVVTQSGAPIAMPWISECGTLVHAFFGGNELGNAIADVLFGKQNPSGKLSLTFPARLEDNPAFHSFGITSDTPGKTFYGEGIYMGYRHYDRMKIEPLFPFGYGLSYTTFAFSELELSNVSPEGDFTATCNVQNTGSVAGREVAQLYVSAPVDKVARNVASPVKELKAFTKITLEPGQKKSVTLKLGKEALSFWNEALDAWSAVEGTYVVRVGGQSNDLILSGEVKLNKSFTWRGL